MSAMHVRLRLGVALAAASAILAGCSDTTPQSDEAMPAASVSAEPEESSEDPAEDAIPEALRGTWGLVAADCDTSRGDAHGNLQIGADTLTFYESVARLGRIDSLSEERIDAVFDLTGEGQEWQSNMVLSVSPDRQTLTRRDRGLDALPEPLTYQRCPG